MPVTHAEHLYIESIVRAAISEEEREALRLTSEGILAEINSIMGSRLLSSQESKAADLAIETLVRLESVQRNKGWFFRAKRRLQLVQMYLGG